MRAYGRTRTKKRTKNRRNMPIRPENKHLYPKNWKEIRQQILERANNCCEFCGVQNYSLRYRGTDIDGMELPPTKIILTIAHLDHNPENCDPNNLRALCQRCHNRYDAKHRAETRARTKALKDKTLFLEFK